MGAGRKHTEDIINIEEKLISSSSLKQQQLDEILNDFRDVFPSELPHAKRKLFSTTSLRSITMKDKEVPKETENEIAQFPSRKWRLFPLTGGK